MARVWTDDDPHFVEEDGRKNFNKNPDGEYKRGFEPYFRKNKFKSGAEWNGNAKGRPVGSKSRKTLRKELLARGGLMPADLLNSVVNDENESMKVRMDAAKILIQYTEAKLASLEIDSTVSVEPNFTFVGFGMDDEDTSGDDDKPTKDD